FWGQAGSLPHRRVRMAASVAHLHHEAISMTRSAHASRRSFIKAAVIGITAPYFIRNLRAAPPSETVRHASFGASGMAGADLGATTSHPNVRLVCVCDVDENHSAALLKSRKDPNLKSYTDYRELLDKEGKNLDSVNVPKPDRKDPVPAGFNWDLWLGVMAERPFIGEGYYHPGNWRKRVDFGTGTFGDMGCHIYDPVFEALGVTAPLSMRSGGEKPSDDN